MKPNIFYVFIVNSNDFAFFGYISDKLSRN